MQSTSASDSSATPTPGQRWINEAELELGLATLIDSDPRTVTLLFAQSEESRCYALNSAPLVRISFSAGDTIQFYPGADPQQTLQSAEVIEAIDDSGLLFYRATNNNGESVVPEGWIDPYMPLHRPKLRLFSGQFDSGHWFELRRSARQAAQQQTADPLRGLSSGRIALLPHQLYIIHQVANRHRPRVLLADEVGLGKTIEAGAIINSQKLNGRAERVLVLVPEPLVHQWLVELRRRFHLEPTLLDNERLIELGEEQSLNPFEQCQLAICSQDLICDPHWQSLAVQAGWDLVVVDEAHHLQWHSQPDLVSAQYRAVEALSSATDGLLLLTATPQQLGIESHFARLRLLDPDRFHSLDQYSNEQQQLLPLAQVLDEIDIGAQLNTGLLDFLQPLLSKNEQQLLAQQQTNREDPLLRRALCAALLDYHGTGRVLYRNSRSAVGGFAKRRAHPHLLPPPAQYSAANLASPTPEQHYRNSGGNDWTRIDPRVAWLLNKLKELSGEKLLVIIHCAESALDFVDYLRIKRGILAAVFHPEMSVVERDRSAAMFADEPDCPLLICSEIGSEGRNFQFAHHLVLLDLPANPDLLEQRIGRLDRIGQQHTVEIHLPLLANSAQHKLLRWHHEAADTIEQHSPAAEPLYRQYVDQIELYKATSSEFDALIVAAAADHQQLKKTLSAGRDRLLERNSCRQPEANEIAEILVESEGQSTLRDFMATLLDAWGVEREAVDEHSWVLHPSSEMAEPFPHLDEGGATVTFDRATALQREEQLFLTWDHPMVLAANEQLLRSSRGNTALATLDGRPLRKIGIAAGTILVELCYLLEAPQPGSRYLAPTASRWLFDEEGRNLAGPLKPEILSQLCKPVGRRLATQAAKTKQHELRKLIELGEQTAKAESEKLVAAAAVKAEQQITLELDRLQTLAERNPLVDSSELAALELERKTLADLLPRLQLRLDAVRVIVVT